MGNVTDITVNLTDVNDEALSDKVEIYFSNQRVKSLSQRITKKFNGTPIVIPGIPSFPEGNHLISIQPTNYRPKKISMLVSKTNSTISEVFFVDPKQARPKLMDFADIANKSYGSQLLQILDNSGIDADFWNNLDKRNRATIFNLSAKILNLETERNLSIFRLIEKIETEQLTKKKRARIFARVNRDLLDEICNSTQVFDPAPGLAHDFFGAWKKFENNSFKSRDEMGNIQFTFATNNDGLFLADIDLDDHKGIEHAFDVIKHKIGDSDTDPYDIHQILSCFQGIKPEYELI